MLPVPLVPHHKHDLCAGPIPDESLADSIEVRQRGELLCPRPVHETVVEQDLDVCARGVGVLGGRAVDDVGQGRFAACRRFATVERGRVGASEGLQLEFYNANELTSQIESGGRQVVIQALTVTLVDVELSHVSMK